SEFLARLEPDNVLMTVVANDLETDSATPRYETPYSLRPIEEASVARWREAVVDASLAIPKPNPFIPDDLAIKPVRIDTPVPVKLPTPGRIEIWHKQDQSFSTPKADFYVSVRSPVVNDSPVNDALSRLYVAMVNDQLNEFSYPADLAGLSYSLYRHVRGFTIRVSGYSAKQDVLLQRIVSALAEPRLDPGRFQILKSDMLRTLKNRRQNRPYERALDDLQDMLIHPQWDEREQIQAISGVTLPQLRDYIGDFFRRLEIVTLAHGNLTPDDARSLVRIVEAKLVARAGFVSVPRARLVRLKPGDRYLREIDTDHEESAAVIYLQGDDRKLATRAAAALISQIVSPPFFEELRTEKQLGYIVFASSMTLLEVPGIALVVQSPVENPAALATHMTGFLKDFHAALKRMDGKEFARHQTALIGNIMEEETRLQERTNRYWTELDREHYEFDLRERLVEAVRVATRDQIESFFRKNLLNASRKQISLYAFGRTREPEVPGRSALSGADAILVQDPSAFKKDKAFFPP
ncbi:MAG: insulinase family protein, partial [Gammaproteobacteria bacterium]|nr:insulinase family protein [Gammaproteobacteria bacterium]